MNHANASLAKTEIIKQLGYFPAFLIPAVNSSLIYRSLVQQTLFAYANNPLPTQFKEKLFVVLSRYFGISYLTICHSCSLRSLGIVAAEILELEEIDYPQSESEIKADLDLLSDNWQAETRWYEDQELENSLLRCSILIFLHPEQTANTSATLKGLLGTVYYHYLVVLLGYIKLCHQWLSSNPHITHQQDRRSQLYLGSLLLEETKLAQFMTAKVNTRYLVLAGDIPEKQTGTNQTQTADDRLGEQTLLSQLRQKTVTTCLANAPFPVMIHNQQGEVIHLNRNWLEASGYDVQEIPTISQWQQKAQVKQKEIVKLVPKNSSQLYRKYVAPAHQTAIEATSALQQIVNSLIEIAPEVVQTRSKAAQKLADAVRSEVTVATKNGAQLHWELYSTVLSFENEADELIISIAKDITEIVQHEAKLAEIEARLRLVLEATKTGNWSWDLNTNQVSVCHRGRIILGLENFDGSYDSFLQSIPPDERESIDLEIARSIQAHQDLDVEYSAVKSINNAAQIKIKGKLNFGSQGKPLRLTGVVMDITPVQRLAKQQSESQPQANSTCGDLEACSLVKQQKMAQSLKELRSIIDLLPYYLFVVDVETKSISLANSNLTASLGWEKEEGIGKAIGEYFPPEYAQQIAWQHQQAIKYKQPLHIQEEVKLPDGVHYFDTVITPLRDTEGKIYALLHTCSDIPDLAATQEALSQRTIQLEAANRELESFSYSVSHDLQAPLRIINGFSQVLWENYQPNLDERGRHYLQRIQANSKRMSDLIDALLQLSRVTRTQMKSIKVNLSVIAQDIIDELRSDYPERAVEIKLAPSLETKGDPQLLRIVLSNLLHNAWKYTSKRSSSQIEFGVITEGAAHPTYFVKDNGAGFDQEYADKLFIAFQRLHSQADFPGTGIGLATVQRIIYRHGGKVWAEGKQDEGATIYFSF
ncbi:MAG: PAS domain S-box protein [Cyanobacteria bacterium J06621_12]